MTTPGARRASTRAEEGAAPGYLKSFRLVVAVAAVTAIITWVVVMGLLRAHSTDVRTATELELTNVTDAVSAFVTSWTADHLAITRVLAMMPPVVGATEAILAGSADAGDATAGLRELLAPFVSEGESHHGYIIADEHGTPLIAELTRDPAWDGEPLLPPGSAAYTDQFVTVVPATSDGDDMRIRMWSLVPTPTGIPAWFGLEFDVDEVAAFVRSTAGASASREVYLFDSDGRLMTPSRFEDQLRDLGIIGPEGSSIGLSLIDPGTNLLDGGSPDGVGRLTLMAESALAGETGSNVDGYRDYRGVTVIGSWRWIDALDIGIATEVDHDEALAVHDRTARLWVLAAGGLTLATVILTGIFVVTARRLDTTRRRLADLADHLEDEVAARTLQLVASQDRLRTEVEARDNLMAAVSHELRTPLTAVMGFAGIVSGAEGLDPDTRDLIDLIVQESTDMADIVDDLLAATRAATGSLTLAQEEIDLLAEAESVVARWDPGETRRVTVRGRRVAAIADPARVRQILRNLVSNATRYGGDTIEVSVDTGAGYTVAVVADDGEPIDDHVRDHMFDLYFRGHDAPGVAPSLGIGLGLSLKLATAMGGTLQFRRTDGRNAFELRLPAAVAAAAEKIA